MRKRKAGRPEKAASELRTIIFRFVATKAEARQIREQAKRRGMSLSDYLRDLAIPK